MRNPIHCALMLVGTFSVWEASMSCSTQNLLQSYRLWFTQGQSWYFSFCVDAPFKNNEPSQVAVKWDAAKTVIITGGIHTGCLNLLRQRLDAGEKGNYLKKRESVPLPDWTITFH